MTSSRDSATDFASVEGFIPVTGGSVWYRIAGTGNRTPLLLLHGGPGVPSHYLETLTALADERPVVFYDQLGCGRSERPTESALWRLERFVRELQQVRDALNLSEVHLLAHSWGTMLAAQYLLESPAGVRSAILAGPVLSAPKHRAGLAVLRRRLPADVRAALDTHEAKGTVSDPEYLEAVEYFYARHMLLLPEAPPELKKATEQMGAESYAAMWGPGELMMMGNLRDFDVTPLVGRLRLPILFTAGRADLTRPEEAEHYQRLIPGAQLEIFEHSAHLTMLEEPQAFVARVRKFLREVELS